MRSHHIDGSEAFAPPPYAGAVRLYRSRASRWGKAILSAIAVAASFTAIGAAVACALAGDAHAGPYQDLDRINAEVNRAYRYPRIYPGDGVRRDCQVLAYRKLSRLVLTGRWDSRTLQAHRVTAVGPTGRTSCHMILVATDDNGRKWVLDDKAYERPRPFVSTLGSYRFDGCRSVTR